MVKPYRLDRGELTIVGLVAAVSTALAHVAGMHPSQAAWAYQAKILGLLPASARDAGEHWDPGEDATADDWARLGAYLGACDGRRRALARQPRATDAHGDGCAYAYNIAYVAAYTVARDT